MSLFGSLDTASGALRAFQQKIATTQGNVNNVSTPGYARQETTLKALPFQPGSEPLGGVAASAQQSTRDVVAEDRVRQQLSALSSFTEQSRTLSRIEATFDLSGNSGVPAALNRFFDAASALAQAPDSGLARQTVLSAAAGAALELNRAADSLVSIRSEVDSKIRATVSEINEIGARIQAYNENALRTGAPDAGLQAQAFAEAESLAQLTGVRVFLERPDPDRSCRRANRVGDGRDLHGSTSGRFLPGRGRMQARRPPSAS